MSNDNKNSKAIMIDYDAEKLATDTARHLEPIFYEIVEYIHKQMENEKEKPMTMNQAKDYLGIHRSTLSRFCKSCKIPFTSLNPDNKMSEKRFYRKDLDKFLEDNRTKTINEIKRDSNG